jgi:hypothetical protein
MSHNALRLVVILGLLAAGTRATPAQRLEGDPGVLGYWVGYQADLMPAAAISWSALTHIAVGPMVPRSNGTVDSSMFVDQDAATTYARQIAQDAIAHGVTPILMIGAAVSRSSSSRPPPSTGPSSSRAWSRSPKTWASRASISTTRATSTSRQSNTCSDG